MASYYKGGVKYSSKSSYLKNTGQKKDKKKSSTPKWKVEQEKIRQQVAERDTGYTRTSASGVVTVVPPKSTMKTGVITQKEPTYSSPSGTSIVDSSQIKTTSTGVTYIEKDGKKMGITQAAYAKEGLSSIGKGIQTALSGGDPHITSGVLTITPTVDTQEPSVFQPAVLGKATKDISSGIIPEGKVVLLTSDTGSGQVIGKGYTKKLTPVETSQIEARELLSDAFGDQFMTTGQMEPAPLAQIDRPPEEIQAQRTLIPQGPSYSPLSSKEQSEIQRKINAASKKLETIKSMTYTLSDGTPSTGTQIEDAQKELDKLKTEYGSSMGLGGFIEPPAPTSVTITEDITKDNGPWNVGNIMGLFGTGVEATGMIVERTEELVSGVPIAGHVIDTVSKFTSFPSGEEIQEVGQAMQEHKGKTGQEIYSDIGVTSGVGYNLYGVADAALGTIKKKDSTEEEISLEDQGPIDKATALERIKEIPKEVKDKGTFSFGDVVNVMGQGIENVGEFLGENTWVQENFELFPESLQHGGKFLQTQKNKEGQEILEEYGLNTGILGKGVNAMAGVFDTGSNLLIDQAAQTQGNKEIRNLLERANLTSEDQISEIVKETTTTKEKVGDTYVDIVKKHNEQIDKHNLGEERFTNLKNLGSAKDETRDEVLAIAETYALEKKYSSAKKEKDEYLKALFTYSEDGSIENLNLVNKEGQEAETSASVFNSSLEQANKEENYAYKAQKLKYQEEEFGKELMSWETDLEMANAEGLVGYQTYIKEHKPEFDALPDYYKTQQERIDTVVSDFGEVVAQGELGTNIIKEINPMAVKQKEAQQGWEVSWDVAEDDRKPFIGESIPETIMNNLGNIGRDSTAALALVNRFGMDVASIGVNTAEVFGGLGTLREIGLNVQEGDYKEAAKDVFIPSFSTMKQLSGNTRASEGLSWREKIGETQVEAIIGAAAVATAVVSVVAPAATSSALTWQAFGRWPSALAYLKGATIVAATPAVARGASYALSSEEEKQAIRNETEFKEYMQAGYAAESEAIHSREGFIGGLTAFASEGPGTRLIGFIGAGQEFVDRVYDAAKADGKSHNEAIVIAKAAQRQRASGYSGEGMGFIGLSALTELGGRAAQDAVTAKFGQASGFWANAGRSAFTISGWGALEGSEAVLGTQWARYEEVDPIEIGIGGAFGFVSAGAVGGALGGAKGLSKSANLFKKTAGKGSGWGLQLATYLTDLGEYLGDKTADLASPIIARITGKTIAKGAVSVPSSIFAASVANTLTQDSDYGSQFNYFAGGQSVGSYTASPEVQNPGVLTASDIYGTGTTANTGLITMNFGGVNSLTNIKTPAPPLNIKPSGVKLSSSFTPSDTMSEGMITEGIDTKFKMFGRPTSTIGLFTDTAKVKIMGEVPQFVNSKTNTKTATEVEFPEDFFSDKTPAPDFSLTTAPTDVRTGIVTSSNLFTDVPSFTDTRLQTDINAFTFTNIASDVFTNTHTETFTNVPSNTLTNTDTGVLTGTNFPRGGFSGLPYGDGLGWGAGAGGLGWGVQNPIAQWAEQYRQRLKTKVAFPKYAGAMGGGMTGPPATMPKEMIRGGKAMKEIKGKTTRKGTKTSPSVNTENTAAAKIKMMLGRR